MSETTIEPHNQSSEKWGGPDPSRCDDGVWREHTGMCGGCGDESCHDGPCVDVESWHYLRVCALCPTRQAQGLVPATPAPTSDGAA